MTYSIRENYSAFNNYNYANKSAVISGLDWLSTPLRRVFGGRDVDVLSTAYEEQMSTAGRVATVFLSVLIFPVAIVSLTSLLIKLATSPYKWEKKIVQLQTDDAWNAINGFNNAVMSKQYDLAIKTLQKNPKLAERKDISQDIYKVINKKINDLSPLEELIPLFLLLQVKDAIALIDYAVQKRLAYEVGHNCNLLSAQNIIDFVQLSLKHASSKDIKSCYEAIFSSALKIDTKEGMLLKLIKMDLIDTMITHFCKSETEITFFKYTLFNDGSLISVIMFDKKSMNELHAIVTGLRDMEKIGLNSLTRLNNASTETYDSQKEHWERLRLEIVYFKNELASKANEEEQQYVQAAQEAFQNIIDTIETFWTVAVATDRVDKIISAVNQLKTIFNEHTASLASFFKATETSNASSIQHFLADAYQIKKTDLIVMTQKIQTFLVNTMINSVAAIVIERCKPINT